MNPFQLSDGFYHLSHKNLVANLFINMPLVKFKSGTKEYSFFKDTDYRRTKSTVIKLEDNSKTIGFLIFYRHGFSGNKSPYYPASQGFKIIPETIDENNVELKSPNSKLWIIAVHDEDYSSISSLKMNSLVNYLNNFNENIRPDPVKIREILRAIYAREGQEFVGKILCPDPCTTSNGGVLKPGSF